MRLTLTLWMLLVVATKVKAVNKRKSMILVMMVLALKGTQGYLLKWKEMAYHPSYQESTHSSTQNLYYAIGPSMVMGVVMKMFFSSTNVRIDLPLQC